MLSWANFWTSSTVFRAFGYIIAAYHHRRAAEQAYLASLPRVVWRKTSIPAVPRKPR